MWVSLFTEDKSIYLNASLLEVFFHLIFGVLILFIKDVTDEFFPTHLQLLNSKCIVVRWISYVALVITIMLAGVFGADQFIYANF